MADARPEVAAIYFPSWHADPRRDERLGVGFTEWDLVRAGRPRFPGHEQPVEPAWGYGDETDPDVMRRSCDAAAGAGIDAFLWDWYWYDGADFLNRPLDDTFLRLPEPGVRFALMWANHDWRHVFPARTGQEPELWWSGRVDGGEWLRMTDVIIDRYLLQPSYWRVGGAAWFTVFQVRELVAGLGGVEATRTALVSFRDRARVGGAGELHLNALGGFDELDPGTIRDLGFDSVGAYGWADRWAAAPPTTRTVAYRDWREAGLAHERAERERQLVETVPTVSVGWDSTTRIDQRDPFTVSDWPFWPVVEGGGPEDLAASTADALDVADRNEAARVVLLNAWNEWTEGSHLEPDVRNGDASLRALGGAIIGWRRT